MLLYRVWRRQKLFPASSADPPVGPRPPLLTYKCCFSLGSATFSPRSPWLFRDALAGGDLLHPQLRQKCLLSPEHQQPPHLRMVVGFREKAGSFAEVADVVGPLRLEH